jgi:hypothetical protein
MEVYKISAKFSKEQRSALTPQLRRLSAKSKDELQQIARMLKAVIKTLWRTRT